MPTGKKLGGREKGTPNKFTASMKEAFRNAFDDLQTETGEPLGHLVSWAKEHPSDFYRICSKLIPQQIQADVTHHDPINEMTDAELESILIERNSTRASKPKGSSKTVH